VIRRLHLWDEAELDVVDAVVWYEAQRVGLGAELLMELDAVMARIAQTPLQFPEIRDGVRALCYIDFRILFTSKSAMKWLKSSLSCINTGVLLFGKSGWTKDYLKGLENLRKTW
jgi:hypothetical protein